MATWAVGSTTVTRIEEQLGPAGAPPEQYLRGLDRDLLERHRGWLVPNHYLPDQDRLITSVHSWLVRTGRHTILIDTCGGNHKHRPWTHRFHMQDRPYLRRLAEAGVSPEAIDIVMCTHLHADHIGWNTMLRDGRWVPTFPNARYLLARKEVEHWNPAMNPAMAADERKGMYIDSVLPVVEAGQAVLVDDGHAVDPELSVEASPGHTAGHVSIALSSAGGRALFCGDAIHHPLQVYAPRWHHMADEHPEEAVATRIRMLERCAGEGTRLFPIHFGAPHVVTISEKAGAFAAAFVAADRP